MADLRCFIAVELPAETKNRIDRQTARLRGLQADVKWVPAENLHFTIKFLGGVPEGQVRRIVEILKEAVRGIKPFEIEVAGAGAFPGMRSPRVFWIGAKDSEARLAGLARQVEDALERAGFFTPKEQKAFTPHLTIGRCRERGRTSPLLAEEMATLGGAAFGKIRLENISLMQSELSPAGARYSRLALVHFGG